jgi:hypothetical protein
MNYAAKKQNKRGGKMKNSLLKVRFAVVGIALALICAANALSFTSTTYADEYNLEVENAMEYTSW